ncbi:MAG: class I SAM-dependent methyltransferase [Trueperaceae bacterium]|nr:class I SAM-dependent methyltransferase [Trueperaceae bacterium]
MVHHDRVRQHYDLASPHYRALWGVHIHHGYWELGDESKELAQEKLVELLARTADVRSGMRLLDVGCGIGGSCVQLATRWGVRVCGITLSPVQAEMARELAAEQHAEVEVRVMDAQAMSFAKEGAPPFDRIWSIEALSHLSDQRAFFQNAAELLAPGGRVAVIDWFEAEGLSDQRRARFVDPIRSGMLTPGMTTMERYAGYLEEAGLRVSVREDLSAHVRRTWDLTIAMLVDRNLWALAAAHGPEFVAFLRAFRAMRRGYASGALRYGMLVAERG